MFRLLCLHTADVEKAAVKNPTATPEEFASAMWNVQTKWPRRGQLLLEVNGETDTPGSWIPKQLGPEDGPVDLTPHIVPGINTIRIIQLAAQTDRIFIVYAGSPPEDEVKEFRNTAAWERLVREN
ncbi:hypothetical protein PHLGIDRAFT_20230 [Phlebiopsis gigantea 11061_1 CR5-6]|uniref:Uncharacterized protein n=1 Tax=Phlebiopsis gigantea (strain 11061_1 CR5-6) TaxID=745531 RepID=A0A0C3S200_PHLG1|nr:hypothetical protein PHLGIDRAFT_20230 [Phlebiopsis gigantea 11061_1 CR5-6]